MHLLLKLMSTSVISTSVCSNILWNNHLVKLSDGNKMSIRQLLEAVFGHKHDFLCVTAVTVAGFYIFFAVIFVFTIKSFNFQRR